MPIGHAGRYEEAGQVLFPGAVDGRRSVVASHTEGYATRPEVGYEQLIEVGSANSHVEAARSFIVAEGACTLRDEDVVLAQVFADYRLADELVQVVNRNAACGVIVVVVGGTVEAVFRNQFHERVGDSFELLFEV